MGLRVKLERKLQEIDEAIFAHITSPAYNHHTYGLYNGTAGIALFYFYLARYTGNPQQSAFAFDLLEKTLEHAEKNIFGQYTLCTGLAGVGWLVNHLQANGFINEDIDEMLLSLDEDLDQVMFDCIEKGNQDFLHGAMGYLLYFLSRNQAHTIPRILPLVGGKLNDKKIATVSGQFSWAAYDIGRHAIKNDVDLGLAHGLPAIVMLLAKAARLQPLIPQLNTLATESLAFLSDQRQAGQRNLFPYFTTSPVKYSRLAWCYGDLSVATALYNAGKFTGRPELMAEACSIVVSSAGRREPELDGVVDTGFCHGTAGIAHIYNRFYHETQNPLFQETAHFWMEQTAYFASVENRPAGCQFWMGEAGWQDNYSLLEGITGVGLAVLSFLSSGKNMEWDQCLLMS